MSAKRNNKMKPNLLKAGLLFALCGVALFSASEFTMTPREWQEGTQIVQSVYLQATAPLPQKSQVLASLMDKIIDCESGGDPTICNREFGCGSGMGLCQIIPSTLKYCEEKLGRELDPFDSEDNLACCWWLIENEGTDHWKMSEHCWAK